MYDSFDFLPGTFVGFSEKRNGIQQHLGKKWFFWMILILSNILATFIKCCKLELENDQNAEKKKEKGGSSESIHGYK